MDDSNNLAYIDLCPIVGGVLDKQGNYYAMQLLYATAGPFFSIQVPCSWKTKVLIDVKMSLINKNAIQNWWVG